MNCSLIGFRIHRLITAVTLLLSMSGWSMGQTVHIQDQEPEQAGGTAKTFRQITAQQRLKWVAYSTIGPQSLGAGVLSAGFGTAIDSPHEYGPHWDGFGKRYGMRLTGISTSNVMEASLGALWGEDPRYFRTSHQPFKNRIGHVVKMTFMAENRNGLAMPAYSRYLAIPSTNFISNTWRCDSNAHASDAVFRTLIGIAGRMVGNAFTEFMPDAREAITHRHDDGNP